MNVYFPIPIIIIKKYIALNNATFKIALKGRLQKPLKAFTKCIVVSLYVAYNLNKTADSVFIQKVSVKSAFYR